MRPDLLVLDAGETVVAAAAVIRHHGPSYPDADRRRAAGLLRLAENRIRHARRRIEAGLDLPPDPERIVDRLIADGWLEASAALYRDAIAEAIADETDPERTRTR